MCRRRCGYTDRVLPGSSRELQEAEADRVCHRASEEPNPDLPSRRGFIKITGCRTCRVEPGRSWLRRRRGGSGRFGPAVQADGGERDPQHLHLLLGRLRHPDLQPRRPRQERGLRHHPHRGRSGPSGQSRHALPEGIGAARHRPFAGPPQGPQIPRAGRERVQGSLLGFRARPNRQADEGGSGQELHRHQQGRDDGQPLALDRACWRRPRPPTRHPT